MSDKLTEHEQGWNDGRQDLLKSMLELAENTDLKTVIQAIKEELEELEEDSE